MVKTYLGYPPSKIRIWVQGGEEYTLTYLTQAMIHTNPAKATSPTVTVNDETHDMTVVFNNSKEGCLICVGGEYQKSGTNDGVMYGSDITSNDRVIILHDGLVWNYEQGEPDSQVLPKIGFYVGGYLNDQTVSTTEYTLVSGCQADTSWGAIQLQTSSNYKNAGGYLPVSLTLKNVRYKIIHDPTPDDGMTYVTTSMIKSDPTKENGRCTISVNNTTHDMTLMFTKLQQGILICSGGVIDGNNVINSDMASLTSSDCVKIYYDDIVWNNGTPSDAAIAKIGFVTNTGSYTLENGATISSTDQGAIAITIDDSYTSVGGSLPVTVTFKNFRYTICKS